MRGTERAPNRDRYVPLGSESAGGAGVTDGDKGDINVAGQIWTVRVGSVTFGKMANMPTASIIYRKAAGDGPPQAQSLATLKADLGLTGNNSGDQDLSGYATIASTVASFQPKATVLTNTTASFTTAQETKLAGIAASATQNATDASLRDRATHTGAQAISTITGLQGVLDGKQASGSYALVGHAHVIGDVTGLQSALDGKAVTAHVHTIANITGLQAALDGKANTGGGGSDPWVWAKLANNVANSTVTLASATGLSFTALANTTYIVEVIGTFQAAATTTGIALALDIPSGSVSGQIIHPENAATLTGTEQIADAATTGATTGVRAINTNVPIMARYIVAVGATGGTVQLQFRSEVAASAVTLQANITALGYRAI